MRVSFTGCEITAAPVNASRTVCAQFTPLKRKRPAQGHRALPARGAFAKSIEQLFAFLGLLCSLLLCRHLRSPSWM
jgi:hypothetical protein